jgi:hypothetical protein
MATSLDLSRTYTSYSGVDIRVIVNGAQVGSMQALSYAIQREKAPIYVMGSVDPVSYSRGKRGIAGTMISLMMDVHLLYTPSFTGERYYGDNDEIRPVVDKDGDLSDVDNEGLEENRGEGIGSISLRKANNAQISYLKEIGSTRGYPGVNGTVLRTEASYDTNDLFENYSVQNVFYVDQILPFDITIVAANEYGQTAQMRLYGCEILNEGSGFSIDDIVIENQMTYVCRTILPWRTIQNTEADKMYKTLLNEDHRGYE